MSELNDTELMGRQVFIREDREEGGAGGKMQTQGQSQGQGQGQGQGQTQMFERSRPFVPQQHVPQYQQQQQQHSSVATGEERKIYVGNLSWEVLTTFVSQTHKYTSGLSFIVTTEY